MRRSRGWAAAVLLAAAVPAGARKVVLVLSDESRANAAAARVGKDVRVLAFDPVRLGDPREKELFLAALQSSERALTVADGPSCGWLGREAAKVPVHCVMSYDARKILDFARAAGWTRIAAVHMTGYEKVYARLRILARAKGIQLDSVRLKETRDLAPALPGVLTTAKAVWILGDPRLTEGAAFAYLIEAALAQRVPLIAPDAGLVARGAFLSAESDPAAVDRYAVETANAAAGGEPVASVVAEFPAGRLVFNRVLARRWGVRVPRGAK